MGETFSDITGAIGSRPLVRLNEISNGPFPEGLERNASFYWVTVSMKYAPPSSVWVESITLIVL